MTLTAIALAATALTLLATGAEGVTGAVALLAVGLCNSIMYPTLFALSLPDDESAAPYASMALCMAVVGGAIVPALTEMLADATSLAASLALPALCYLGIAWFGLACSSAWARKRLAAA